jgi:hypothetical protein
MQELVRTKKAYRVSVEDDKNPDCRVEEIVLVGSTEGRDEARYSFFHSQKAKGSSYTYRKIRALREVSQDIYNDAYTLKQIEHSKNLVNYLEQNPNRKVIVFSRSLQKYLKNGDGFQFEANLPSEAHLFHSSSSFLYYTFSYNTDILFEVVEETIQKEEEPSFLVKLGKWFVSLLPNW